MVHDDASGVNALYCWRDLRRLVHLAWRTGGPGVTLCGKSVSTLKYAGREDVSTARPTCIQCVLIR